MWVTQELYKHCLCKCVYDCLNGFSGKSWWISQTLTWTFKIGLKGKIYNVFFPPIKKKILIISHLLLLIEQDEGVVMGTVRRDGHGPAGLPDTGRVCGEPVLQGAAGTQHEWLFSTLAAMGPCWHSFSDSFQTRHACWGLKAETSSSHIFQQSNMNTNTHTKKYTTWRHTAVPVNN